MLKLLCIVDATIRNNSFINTLLIITSPPSVHDPFLQRKQLKQAELE